MMDLRAQFKGSFLAEPEVLAAKLQGVKVFIFDWDGVFNAGWKDAEGSSAFNEVDSMGTNLLRFNHYLRNDAPPLAFIISGETNKAALRFANREHFNGVYCGIKHKRTALDQICAAYGIVPAQVCFMFDDIVDFSIAGVAGLRIMVGRECNPLMMQWATTKGMVDYLTNASGADYAVREMVELLTGLSGKYDETMNERAAFTETYKAYLKARNAAETKLFVLENDVITEKKSL